MSEASERERHQRIEAVFFEAAERPAAERADFLAEACGADGEMRRAVERLLALDDEDDAFLGATPWTTSVRDEVLAAGAAAGTAAAEGAVVGRYRLVRRVGRGGMGEVWLADRSDEAFEDRVALKLIRRGLDTDDLLARFRNERQVLANLRHPNIATLLDGDATEDGRPYLVMEYVDGVSIDAWCRDRGLSLEERLELFLKVCAAVQHAHRNLVVHRDIKPSNVMVSEGGEPKLLDFGIAKVLEPGGVETEATLTSERRFTPLFASPEQARGEALTTATDVYSLGALLYLLLTGAPPHDLTEVAPVDYTRVICETEPRRPSELVERASRRPLTGDLDRITLMALRPEPERRYDSVEQFADDVRRHLAGLPVRAQPDTFGYRAGKFVRRNRLAVVSTAIVTVALVAAVAVSATFAVGEARQRAAAEQQAAIATAVDEFLRVDLLGRAAPDEEPDRDITLRAVLDRAAAAIGDRFEGQPLVHAAVRGTLGTAYDGLGEYEAALRHQEVAFALRRAELGTADEATLESMSALAGLHLEMGHLEEAGALLEELLTLSRAALGEGHRLTLTVMGDMADLHDARGEYDEAIDAATLALAGHRTHLGVEDPDTLTAMNDLGLMLTDSGRYDEAAPLLREAFDVRTRVFGPEHPDTLLSIASLGYLLTDLGELEEAQRLLEQAVDTARRVLGPEHHRLAAYLNLLATVQNDRGLHDDAARSAGAALDIRRASLGARHADTQQSMNLLATVLAAAGRFDEAEPLFRETLEARRAALGPDHPRTLIAANNLADMHLRAERPAAAAPLAAEAVAGARDALPEGHWYLGVFLTNQGRAQAGLGRTDEARATFGEARAILVETFGDGHARVERVDTLLAELPGN